MLDLGQALEALSRAGLRRTPQRVAVIEALAGNETHPTVEAIWRSIRRTMPSISMSTIYSTLRELENLGLIQQVSDDPIRVDPDAAPHLHLACESCGRIVDVPDGAAIDEARESAERMGHTVEKVTVSLAGVCEHCRGGRRVGHA